MLGFREPLLPIALSRSLEPTVQIVTVQFEIPPSKPTSSGPNLLPSAPDLLPDRYSQALFESQAARSRIWSNNPQSYQLRFPRQTSMNVIIGSHDNRKWSYGTNDPHLFRDDGNKFLFIFGFSFTRETVSLSLGEIL